ncbi:MAG TPA: molybdopterin-synthase adenylyltransferase MoeB [Planctomycetota bacterium]|nr:molybdopterin-synthase adenylyltransferase MoeB [Planctomycetota bacterium]
MPSVKDQWLSKLRSEIPEVSPEDVRKLIDTKDSAVTLVDVRESDEYRQGKVPGARHLPRGFLELRAGEKLPDRKAKIVAYCAGGVRSLFAAASLKKLGYENVASMSGGYTRWKQNGHPFVAPEEPEDRKPETDDVPAGATAELARLRGEIPEISPAEAQKLLAAGNGNVILLDVREGDEFRQGRLAGAVSLPRGFLELQAEQKLPDSARTYIVYSTDGVRSLLAATTLRQLGFKNAVSLAGGLRRWEAEGLAVQVPETLTDRERERYLRHISIEEVGEAGQLKLKKAKVLCIGAGGLGSPAAYYLAAAGVGTIGLVDYDVVDRSNLQRQILHGEDRIGVLKTESARKTLVGLNPDIRVIAHNERLTSANVDSIFSKYDVVLDGCDNFPTRYLVNDACVKHKLPNVHGSIYRFEGQATVFWPGKGPCYRCLYPEPPPPELAPSCAEAGVLGVLPGIIGCLEANEVIKIILNIGRPLVGRLLTFDALEMSFHELKLRRDPNCAYCGGGPFPGYQDYVQFCGV